MHLEDGTNIFQTDTQSPSKHFYSIISGRTATASQIADVLEVDFAFGRCSEGLYQN